MSTTDRSAARHLAGEAETRWRTLPEVTSDMHRRAQLAVAGSAEDVEDCRMLLDMLGLSTKARRSAA